MPVLYDVIIVGAGPAAIFAALKLTREKPDLKIIMLEKGKLIDQRICPTQEQGNSCLRCNPCAITCGWGGAGAFSDGKLTLTPEVGGSLDQHVQENELKQLIAEVDEEYLRFGAPQKIYGLERREEVEKISQEAEKAQLRLVPIPIRHLGTGRCGEILNRMYVHLVQRGVEVRANCRVVSVLTDQERVLGVTTSTGEEIRGHFVILAPGREGSAWLTAEARRLGIKMAANPVDIGVRVELPASVMSSLTDIFYEMKLIYYSKAFDDKVRTFCMNPYGEVVQENNDGLITVNGHTHAYRRTSNTNFAVLVSKNFTEPFKDPILYARCIASLANLLGGGVLVQRLGDLLAGRRSTPSSMQKCLTVPTLPEATPGDLSLVFPHRHLVSIVEMLEAIDNVAKGTFSRYTLLYGVEVKFYSSRLELGKGLSTRFENMFAAGDGAGVTRGLVQASASGLVAAAEILNRL